jgi:hypothetical protein
MASTAKSGHVICLHGWDIKIRREPTNIPFRKSAQLTPDICQQHKNAEMTIAVISGISMTCNAKEVFAVNSEDAKSLMEKARRQEQCWRDGLKDSGHKTVHEAYKFLLNVLAARIDVAQDALAAAGDGDDVVGDCDADMASHMPKLEADAATPPPVASAAVNATIAMAKAAAAAAEAAARSISNPPAPAGMDIDSGHNATPPNSSSPPAPAPDVKPPRSDDEKRRERHALFARQNAYPHANKHAPPVAPERPRQRQPPSNSPLDATLTSMFERLAILGDAKAKVGKQCIPDEHNRLSTAQATAKARVKTLFKDATADLYAAALSGTDFVSTYYKYDQGAAAVFCGVIKWHAKDSVASHQLEVQATYEEIAVYAAHSELETNIVPLLVVKATAFERVCNGIGTRKSGKKIENNDAYSGKMKIDGRIVDVIALNCCSIPLISASKTIQCHIERQVQTLLLTYTSGRGEASGPATASSACNQGVDYNS